MKAYEIIFQLLRQPGIGTAKVNHMIEYARRSARDYDSQVGILSSFLNTDLFAEEPPAPMERLRSSGRLGVKYVTALDPEYPQSILSMDLAHRPPILSLLGNIDLLSTPTIGFGGSRKVSETGLEITRDCAAQCITSDFTVISGYAKGVDMMAHRTALETGGATIIVLPNGIDEFHIHRELREIWNWSKVLVLSEFLPEAKWTVSRAMTRNRTIVALSQAMLILEAGETGGSLDAGFRAIEAGKDLYVVDYQQPPISAAGNRMLLLRGAKGIRRSSVTSRANLTAALAAATFRHYLVTHNSDS